MVGPAVVVITGIMAAGKSTVAQLLAERLDRAAHVRGDLFRRMIVSGRADLTPGAEEDAVAQLRLRHRLTASVADGYADAGFTLARLPGLKSVGSDPAALRTAGGWVAECRHVPLR